MMGYDRDKSDEEKKFIYLHDVFRNDFLPHLENDPLVKARYLGFMCYRLIMAACGHHPTDDRDAYQNKKIDTPGVLISTLFRQYLSKLIKELKTGVNKEFVNGSWRF